MWNGYNQDVPGLKPLLKQTNNDLSVMDNDITASCRVNVFYNCTKMCRLTMMFAIRMLDSQDVMVPSSISISHTVSWQPVASWIPQKYCKRNRLRNYDRHYFELTILEFTFWLNFFSLSNIIYYLLNFLLLSYMYTVVRKLYKKVTFGLQLCIC